MLAWMFPVGGVPGPEEEGWAAASAQCRLWSPAGKSSCRASLGGASQSEAHRAFILQLGPSEDCTWTLARPGDRAIRIVFSHRQ